MEGKTNDQLGFMMSELEGRVAGVLARFFKDKRDLMTELGKERAHDPEMMELSLATNALLFQLAALIVMIQQKTGGNLEDIIRIESEMLKLILPTCKNLSIKSTPKNAEIH